MTVKWTNRNPKVRSPSLPVKKLDNLVFVINCNLQRLDGPVTGNGKIINELEGIFEGAGWNVIKVMWGSRWDELLRKDTSGKTDPADERNR
ncbi:pyruvate dehydrogenase E1 component [Escherichia coli]|uniref:Pyruvate dehydrogenase E1 component n=1 Tax=Escherichia coli TaxID=562 RepID=A0A377CH63_ECOLX|nr:pyruvate dehydrogenase E1 component [Escherichia coli]